MADLVSVHNFYVAILESGLGYQVPLPPEVIQARAGSEQTKEIVLALLRWLGMLDLAISPPMVRDQLYATKDNDSADALLRYYVKKCSVSDLDRDKADCVLGFLCRHPGKGATTLLEKLSTDHPDHVAAVRAFKTEIDRVLHGMQHRDLPAEHAQLLREYDFFYQELSDFRTFDQLMDCGILGRIHNLKKSFATSFYHPDVLSSAGVFNGVFGKRFDELFLEATQQIKTFAARVQQEGTSIMSRVDGDVRVKQLTEVQDEQILDKEYGQAREDFEKVSSFKKAVDKRRINSQAPQGRLISERLSSDSDRAAASPAVKSETQVTDPFVAAHAIAEESKFRQAGDQIRMFVRAADPKVCFTVPLPKRNLSLTPPEADAFRSDYGLEESFRARYADALVKLVTAKVRVTNELLDFQEKQNSAYLWKPHADSLMYLMKFFERLQEEANELVAAAGQRGLTEKANAVTTARNNLHAALQSATQSLQSLQTAQR
jgi:hypothetical protein